MLGLEIMTAAMLMNTQGYSQSMTVAFPYSCNVRKAPHITVKPSQSRVTYDFSKSKAQLNRMNTDTVSPYGPHHKTNVSGLMSGTIQLKSNVSFVTEKYDQFGIGCTYLKAINVTINIDPVVYVASDFEQGGCMHNAILAHEMKHVNEDQYVVNKYINEIGRALSQKIDELGSAYGPLKFGNMEQQQQYIQEQLHDEVRYMNKQLNEERRTRQQAIDSLEEYESIGNKCKSRNQPRRR